MIEPHLRCHNIHHCGPQASTLLCSVVIVQIGGHQGRTTQERVSIVAERGRLNFVRRSIDDGIDL